MSGEMLSFEALRDQIRGARKAEAQHSRLVKWIDPLERLAFARDEEGCVEIFLAGPRLIPIDAAVEQRLVFDTWRRANAARFDANRLVLPGGEHFDALAATVLVELVRGGYADSPEMAFAGVEPLIALAFQAVSEAPQIVTGLAGELMTLAWLIRSGMDAVAVVEGWQGWEPSSRDLRLGSVGVEIKTTTLTASRHHVSGWFQVESGLPGDDFNETQFFLLSLGIEWLPPSFSDATGETPELLIKEIVSVLPEEEGTRFVERVRSYLGNQHPLEPDGTAGTQTLKRPFTNTFVRLYDMGDQNVRVPRSADLADFSHAVLDSVRFEIALPSRVSGDVNPTHGAGPTLRAIRVAYQGG